VANGEASCLVALGSSKLGGQWGSILFDDLSKVPSLVAFKRRMRNILFTCFHFPLNKFYLNFFFIDFEVLHYHGSRP